MSTKNILAVYNLASVADTQQGQSWYARALVFAVRLSDEYNIDTKTIVAVIASLSPGS